MSPDTWDEVRRIFAAAIELRIAVGAYMDESGGPGAAYVYDRPASGWTSSVETVVIPAPAQETVGRFGQWIDVDGDLLLVGAPREGLSGAAHAFSLTSEGCCPGDVNNDGVVDVDDLIAVILGWGCLRPWESALQSSATRTSS